MEIAIWIIGVAVFVLIIMVIGVLIDHKITKEIVDEQQNNLDLVARKWTATEGMLNGFIKELGYEHKKSVFQKIKK